MHVRIEYALPLEHYLQGVIGWAHETQRQSRQTPEKEIEKELC